MGKLNVAIADDNEVMRDLLEEMVTSDDELHLIGCCIIGYYYAETGRSGSP